MNNYKKIIICAFIIVLGVFSYIIYDFASGNHISQQYDFEGHNDNWKIDVHILEVEENQYNIVTNIEYLKSKEVPTTISWMLKGKSFGTGGGDRELDNGKLRGKDVISDVFISTEDKFVISIESGENLKEEITLSSKNSK